MANINFVPDDYIQKKQSNRTNWMYLFLCVAMLVALGGTFGMIKVRQSSITRQAMEIDQKMAQAQKDIQQFEQLQIKRKQMMQKALTAVELLEDVPRSNIVAAITNNLPSGTSLLSSFLNEKTEKASSVRTGSYAQAKSASAVRETVVTKIELEGVAPSDREVAEFIANLDRCEMFSSVNLIYTKEFKADKNDMDSIRMFKVSTSLSENVKLTRDFVESLKFKGV